MIEQNKSLRAKAASGGRWTATSAIACVILQIAQLAILGRMLGPAEFGLMAIMMLVIGLTVSISDFGLGNYIVQKENLSRKTLFKVLMVVTGMAALMACLITLSANLIADYYSQPALVELLPWLSISIVISTISQILMSLLQRFIEFKQIALGEILSGALTLFSATLVAYLGYGIWALLIGQIVAVTTRTLFFSRSFYSLVLKLKENENDNNTHAVRFACYQTGERLLNFISWNLDKAIIGRMLGDIGLGFYSVAFQLMIRPLSVLNPIFTRVALPLFIGIRSDDTRIRNAYLQTIKTIALLSFPLYMFMAISSNAIVIILMGHKWVEAGPILYVLSFLGIFFSIGNPIGTLVLVKSKPEWAFYFNLICLVVYVFAFWLGSYYSVLGVAIAFLIAAFTVVFPIEFYLRYKLVGMNVLQYFKAMQHIFVGIIVPLLIHAVTYLLIMQNVSILAQFSMSFAAIIFFYGYIFIFDRELMHSVFNIMLRGK